MHSKLLLCFGLTGSLVLFGCADDGGSDGESTATETGDGDGDPGDGDGDPGDGDPGDGDGEPGDGDGEPGDGDGEPGDGDGEPGDGDGDGDGEPGDGDGEPGDGDGEPGDGDGEPGDGDGDPGDGDGDPGDGNCKVTYETCDALQAAFAAETEAIRSCTEDSQCGQVLNGTSCGCTRDWVARIDADTECFYALIEQAEAIQCGLPLFSTCDCPPADGYVCFDGICSWNYL